MSMFFLPQLSLKARATDVYNEVQQAYDTILHN